LANSRLAPSYSVFTALSAADGTSGTQNRVGASSDFSSWYANGQNGALKQIVWAVEQSAVKGAPIGEVQEPTTATTAAAFDEGGNFIDVRFGPLSRGTCTISSTFTSPTCTTSWTDFGTYNPAQPSSGNFMTGLSQASTNTSNLVTILLQKDRNAVPRLGSNWIRGALAQ